MKGFMMKLEKYAKDKPDKLAAAMFQEAEEIMGESKEKYVPVDTATLKSSGFVLPPNMYGNKILVEFGFGGPAAPYAITVHEDLDAKHTVGSAKYLEKPIMEAKNKIIPNIVNRIERG